METNYDAWIESWKKVPDSVSIVSWILKFRGWLIFEITVLKHVVSRVVYILQLSNSHFQCHDSAFFIIAMSQKLF